jgi:hypothetical protein
MINLMQLRGYRPLFFDRGRRMQKKKICRHIITLLMLACLSENVFADEIALQANHPQRYVVKKGDTLWGISGKFLKNPWQWPKIWKMNRSEIKNPHWIYPGDTIVLNMVNGQPQLALERGTVMLNPDVRIEDLSAKEGIKALPPSVIGPFLTQPLLVENEEMENAPRIIGGQDGRLVLSPGTRVYIDSIKEGAGLNWDVYRPGAPFVDPDTKEVLGTEANYLGDVKVARYGEPATADVVRAKEEIFTKDRLVLAPEEFRDGFVPHAPENQVKGRILRIYGGVGETGPNYVVTINLGKRDGMEPGHVLAIDRYGKTIKVSDMKNADGSVKKDGEVKLPDERVGLLMIFRTFERVSYGLVMNSSDSIHELDAVHTP